MWKRLKDFPLVRTNSHATVICWYIFYYHRHDSLIKKNEIVAKNLRNHWCRLVHATKNLLSSQKVFFSHNSEIIAFFYVRFVSSVRLFQLVSRCGWNNIFIFICSLFLLRFFPLRIYLLWSSRWVVEVSWRR